MSATEILVAVAIVIGIAGTLFPIIPGSLLVGAAIVVWATEQGTTQAWVVVGIAVVLILIGSLAKFLMPGRRLKQSGVPNRSLVVGGVVAVIGFFVVPVVGLLFGFVLGIYLAERQRLGTHAAAWPSTVSALKAVGVSMLIEFSAACLAGLTWFVAVMRT